MHRWVCMLHINYVYTVLVTEWIFCQQPLWDRPVVWDHTSNPLNYLWGTASHICHRDGPHCQICTSANGALNQAKHVHFECVWWLIYIYELLLLVLSQKETRARPHPKPINYVRGTATHICCYCQTCSCAETNLWAIDLSNDPPLSHQILLVTHSEPSYRW